LSTTLTHALKPCTTTTTTTPQPHIFPPPLSPSPHKKKHTQDHIEASKELRKSETFKLLLSITLGLGNFVNHGSRQGNAGGFRLKTLNKLHDSKTPDL
jgi:hypothetical protein